MTGAKITIQSDLPVLNALFQKYKMNAIVNKLLLAGYKCMPKIYFKQSGFTCSACGPFAKNKESIKKFKETRDLRYIYQNELVKACFQHDMAYSGFKNLDRITAIAYKCFDKQNFWWNS